MNTALLAPVDVRLMNLAASALLLALAGLMLVALGTWLLRLPAFSLTHITVQGEVTHNNAITLRANVAPKLVGNFFSLDLAQARAAFEAVPWVRQAAVWREFPNRLAVQLQEHQAVAYWGSDADSTLVNDHGEVFEANLDDIDTDTLPRLSGPVEQSAQVLALYRALLPEFERLDLPLQALHLSGRGSWQAVLESGAAIELGSGSPSELLARVRRFLYTLTQVTARYGRKPGYLESADLRHPEGYALRLRGVSTTAPMTSKN